MDYNLWQQLILGATKPFRTGANILAQNWGSALTGKDMSQRENQGRFLRWLSEGITPEEQQVITEKPYLSALKSGAGMASTLAPFASQGLRTAQLAANPLANRIAQLTSQGALEGSLGGFGYSGEGREVQDTLTGGLVGAGGELFMDYLTNPQFRKLVTDATTTVNPQTGVRMYKGVLENKPENGEQILYHQSQSKEPFTEFRQKGDQGYRKAYYSQAGEGIYFSPNKDLVKQMYGKNGGTLVEATIKPKNLLDLGEFDAMYFDGRKINYADIVTENFKRQMQGLPELPEPDIILTNITKKAKNWLLENGYDAAKGMQGPMHAAPEVVVLNKSIINRIR